MERIPPHDLAKESDGQVVVALMSGRSCGCDFSQTIGQLKEEAQSEEKTLEEENVLPGSSLTVVAVDQEEEDEREAAENQCQDIFAAGAATWAPCGSCCGRRLYPAAPCNQRQLCGCSEATDRVEGLECEGQQWSDPLNLAAGKGHVEICSILAADVDVNVTGQNGSTPLHDAAFGGHADVVTLLLEDTSRDDPGGMTAPGGPGGLRLCQTPLDVARNQGQHEVATLLESVAE